MFKSPLSKGNPKYDCFTKITFINLFFQKLVILIIICFNILLIVLRLVLEKVVICMAVKSTEKQFNNFPKFLLFAQCGNEQNTYFDTEKKSKKIN